MYYENKLNLFIELSDLLLKLWTHINFTPYNADCRYSVINYFKCHGKPSKLSTMSMREFI